jgi:hypothetical protein
VVIEIGNEEQDRGHESIHSNEVTFACLLAAAN